MGIAFYVMSQGGLFERMCYASPFVATLNFKNQSRKKPEQEKNKENIGLKQGVFFSFRGMR